MSITLATGGIRPQQGAGRRARVLGIVAGAAAVIAGALAFTAQPAVHRNVTRSAAGVAPLDMLRASASLGDAWASRQLVDGLLDRYDRTHDEHALVEAVLWFDRDWDSVEYLNSALAARLLERECAHPVLRWHWLCVAGE